AAAARGAVPAAPGRAARRLTARATGAAALVAPAARAAAAPEAGGHDPEQGHDSEPGAILHGHPQMYAETSADRSQKITRPWVSAPPRVPSETSGTWSGRTRAAPAAAPDVDRASSGSRARDPAGCATP